MWGNSPEEKNSKIFKKKKNTKKMLCISKQGILKRHTAEHFNPPTKEGSLTKMWRNNEWVVPPMYITGILQPLMGEHTGWRRWWLEKREVFNLQAGQEKAAGEWIMISPPLETTSEVPLT